VAGALFASTEYNLFPYFMVGYICSLYEIARRPAEDTGTRGTQLQNGNQEELGYGGSAERELAWTR
jgi:hypothetical protein